MSTLITLTLPNGTIHMCDESCYNSTGPDCTCICAGRNHGQGISQAEHNTIMDAGQLVDELHRCYPNPIEVRFHFHYTGHPQNLTRHEVLDAQYAAMTHPSEFLNQAHPDHGPLFINERHQKPNHAHPAKAAQADRDEPNR